MQNSRTHPFWQAINYLSGLRFAPPVLLLAAVSVYWLLLIQGVDFGYHWDERHLMKSAAQVPETGLVLPRWYNYPSMSFLITLISLAAYIVWEVLQQSVPFLGGADESSALPVRALAKAVLTRQQELIEIQSVSQPKEDFWIFARVVFASLSALAVPVIYLVLSRLAGRWIALSVGLLLMGSFHIFFHARWIAPDMLQVLWMALLLLFTLSFLERGGAWRLNVVAMIAGVMIATKYPAGVFLLCPLILANLERFDFMGSVRVILVATACYLVITPGTFVEPMQFAYGVLWEIEHYSRLGHDVSTVSSGFAHLTQLAEYFALRVLNMNPFVSGLLWVLILIGMANGIFRHRRLTLVVLLPALLYFFYLSTQKVMIVRNALILLPVLCLYLALGLDRIGKAAGRYETPFRMGTALFALLVFSVSASGFAAANASLLQPAAGNEAAERILSAAAEQDGAVYVSDAVAGMLRASGRVTAGQLAQPAVIDRFDTSAVAIYMISETEKKSGYFESGDWRQIGLANRRGLYTTLAGPQDVDLDYYPNWKGLDRVVMTSPAAGANFAYWKLSGPWELRLQN